MAIAEMQIVILKVIVAVWHVLLAYLLAPPASGETMVQFFHSGMFSLIHFSTAGSAYKLSTGISKNPWKEVYGLELSELNTEDQHKAHVSLC